MFYTFVTVKELNPEEYAEFHGLDTKKDEKKEDPAVGQVRQGGSQKHFSKHPGVKA